MKCPKCQREMLQLTKGGIDMTELYDDSEPIPQEILVDLKTHYRCEECSTEVFTHEGFTYVPERRINDEMRKVSG